ncbi:hypothetical protein AMTRI_Chr03g44430 [Amborella trichopoda]|uniref:3-oxoacyl-[acyl-carrier-protein] reductase n=1 Tax=Amborella trichopoda TaxID=13333 RepID=W1PU62_AMBTC|nr:uncharacterized protein LOC18439802 [Amborella trichopoda]ERN11603.1 hypothetical protein AMTR_s00022p00187970 [Amborella trichopoda]|eukprot:XP_006850022.1 uncharacterized protein LOC18439802 [Amborella trichopoda]
MAMKDISPVDLPENPRYINGKVIMVTGASSGLGREFCLSLAKSGCKILACARRTELLRSLCEEINSLNVSFGEFSGQNSGEAVSVKVDVSQNGKAIDEAVQLAWNIYGRIDALINNAGIRGHVASPLDLDEEEWNSVMATNLRGTWLVARSVCRRMCDANQKGSVINISSIGGLPRGLLPGGIAYAISKAGVDVMTKVMALELGKYNIRVNSIAPGLFKSDITARLVQKDWIDKVAERIIPLRTHGTIDPALTSLLDHLIDDSSGFVTGNVFIVDCGATLPGVPLYSSL